MLDGLVVRHVFLASDWASLQVKENGVAQAAVQTASQGSGGLLQDDPSLQHPHVKPSLILTKSLKIYNTEGFALAIAVLTHPHWSFVSQAQGNQHVLGCIQAQLVRDWGLLIWGQDDWRLICKSSSSFIRLLIETYCLQCILKLLSRFILSLLIRKPWRKKRKRRKRPRQSLTPFISWFFISAAQLLQKRRKSLQATFKSTYSFFSAITWFLSYVLSLQ